MQENKYDDNPFFERYAQMERSQKGLAGAGEWPAFQQLLPDFKGQDVLDLGCGYGWHCRYAAEHGARAVLGVDLSEKMLQRANEINLLPGITYRRQPIETLAFPTAKWDTVISSLAFHYVAAYDTLCQHIHHWLKPGGSLVFSVEHPAFTAQGIQDWHYDATGERRHWPVDNYFDEGKREAVFLGEKVVKYHRTLTTYLNTLLGLGFILERVVEPTPSPGLLTEFPELKHELRRPMMLLISARKSS